MGRVLANNVSLAVTKLTAAGALPASPDWKLLEPNPPIGVFGSTISTISRNPISRSRQNKKGTTSDQDSAVEYSADLTLASFQDFDDGLLFANTVNGNLLNIPVTAVVASTDAYTVSAIAGADASNFETGTLIWATGFSNNANNGLKTVDADISSGATAISVGENLVNATENAYLSFAGYRVPAAAANVWVYSAPQGTLTASGAGTILQGMGVEAGMFVHIGSVESVGDSVQNGLADGVYGMARVVSISNNSITFDKLDSKLQAAQAIATAVTVDIVFGAFTRNVAVDDADYLEQEYEFEATFPNLGAAGANEFEYVNRNLINTATYNIPLTDKATIDYSFVARDSEEGILDAGRHTGAATAQEPVGTSPFNTSADVIRLRIVDVDQNGITTDFKSASVAITNNVTPEKVVGCCGRKVPEYR